MITAEEQVFALELKHKDNEELTWMLSAQLDYLAKKGITHVSKDEVYRYEQILNELNSRKGR